MSVGAIIQARTSSTRLPGKVLMELPYGSGITVLQQVVRRCLKCDSLDAVVIATTGNAQDDPIVSVAGEEKVPFFRGDEIDVLSRYYYAARDNGLNTIVRVTSDCPCVDPKTIDKVLNTLIETGADYASNTLTRSYPHGLDVEAFTFEALGRAYEEATEPHDREHVTPYLYRHGKFRTAGFESPLELVRPGIRITLDTEEDYALLCAVYDYLYRDNALFCHADIVRLFDSKPWLMAINGKVLQKSLVCTLEGEIAEAIKLLELQGLQRASEALRKYEAADKS